MNKEQSKPKKSIKGLILLAIILFILLIVSLMFIARQKSEKVEGVKDYTKKEPLDLVSEPQPKTNQAEYDLQRIEVEKQQIIATAQGEAEAIRIRAEALKSNPQLVQFTMAEKWNGQFPQVMMGSGTPLLDISGFLQTKATSQ